MILGNVVPVEITRTWPDYAQLIAIEERAANLFRQVGYNPSDWATGHPEDFARHEANGLLWVATIGHQPVGFAVADLFGVHLHLEELDVDPAYQRRGIGSCLVSAVITEARERLLHSVTLRTFSTTPWSVGLYERHGFKAADEASLPAYLAPHLERERRMGLPIADRCTMILRLPSE